MLTVSLCTGMTFVQRVVSLCWILGFAYGLNLAIRKGILIRKLVRDALLCQIPALVFILTEPFAASRHFDGWTDGFLALWETPFEPLLELLPPFHLGHLSSMYVEDCTIPFVLPTLTMVLGWLVQHGETRRRQRGRWPMRTIRISVQWEEANWPVTLPLKLLAGMIFFRKTNPLFGGKFKVWGFDAHVCPISCGNPRCLWY